MLLPSTLLVDKCSLERRGAMSDQILGFLLLIFLYLGICHVKGKARETFLNLFYSQYLYCSNKTVTILTCLLSNST